jgi:ribosomal protein S10
MPSLRERQAAKAYKSSTNKPALLRYARDIVARFSGTTMTMNGNAPTRTRRPPAAVARIPELRSEFGKHFKAVRQLRQVNEMQTRFAHF